MGSVQRAPSSPASPRSQQRSPLEWRLRQENKRLSTENENLRREVVELQAEVLNLTCLTSELDPDGSRTYAWLLGLS